jgi:hypothetical protein
MPKCLALRIPQVPKCSTLAPFDSAVPGCRANACSPVRARVRQSNRQRHGTLWPRYRRKASLPTDGTEGLSGLERGSSTRCR